MRNDLIGIREAAEILEIPRSTFSRYVANGRVKPYAKLPGRTRVYIFELEQIERLKANGNLLPNNE